MRTRSAPPTPNATTVRRTLVDEDSGERHAELWHDPGGIILPLR